MLTVAWDQHLLAFLFWFLFAWLRPTVHLDLDALYILVIFLTVILWDEYNFDAGYNMGPKSSFPRSMVYDFSWVVCTFTIFIMTIQLYSILFVGYERLCEKKKKKTQRNSISENINDFPKVENLWEMVKDREAWHAAVHEVAKSDTTEQLNNKKLKRNEVLKNTWDFQLGPIFFPLLDHCSFIYFLKSRIFSIVLQGLQHIQAYIHLFLVWI